MSWNSASYYRLKPTASFSVLGSNTLGSILLSDTLNLFSYLMWGKTWSSIICIWTGTPNPGIWSPELFRPKANATSFSVSTRILHPRKSVLDVNSPNQPTHCTNIRMSEPILTLHLYVFITWMPLSLFPNATDLVWEQQQSSENVKAFKTTNDFFSFFSFLELEEVIGIFFLILPISKLCKCLLKLRKCFYPSTFLFYRFARCSSYQHNFCSWSRHHTSTLYTKLKIVFTRRSCICRIATTIYCYVQKEQKNITALKNK